MRIINRNLAIICLASLVALVTFLGSRQIRLLRDSASGDLLSNRTEAYLFIALAARGYRMNYFHYVGCLLAERLGGLCVPVDEHRSSLVLHITPERVERYPLNDDHFNLYASFQGAIYANHQGQLWKWSETHFIPVSEVEAQGFQEARASSKIDSDGWSTRVNVFNRRIGQTEFPLEIGGKMFSLVVTIAPVASEVSVDLVSTHESSRLWHLDERTRRVSGSEYRSLFQNR
jgi:hypothetical protein